MTTPDIPTESTAESRAALAAEVATPVVTTDYGSLEARKAFNAALSLAQGEFEPILKNRAVRIEMKNGGSYNFRYADLQEIQQKTRPALSRHGLSTTSQMVPSETGVHLAVILMHAEGFERVSEVFVTYGEEIKQFGAKLKYMRRYITTGLLDVDADDDLDENGDDGGAGSTPVDHGRTGDYDRAPAPAPRPARKAPAAPRAAAPAQAPAEDDMPPAPPLEGSTEKPGVAAAATPADVEREVQRQMNANDAPDVGAEPAQAPAAAPAEDEADKPGDGECMFLVKRAMKRSQDGTLMTSVLKELGYTLDAKTLKGATRAQWNAIKDRI